MGEQPWALRLQLLQRQPLQSLPHAPEGSADQQCKTFAKDYETQLSTTCIGILTLSEGSTALARQETMCCLQPCLDARCAVCWHCLADTRDIIHCTSHPWDLVCISCMVSGMVRAKFSR